jgi:hypothetical protein
MENFPRITLIEWKIFHVLAYYMRKVENTPKNFPLFVFRIYSIQQPLSQPTQFSGQNQEKSSLDRAFSYQGFELKGVFLNTNPTHLYIEYVDIF